MTEDKKHKNKLNWPKSIGVILLLVAVFFVILFIFGNKENLENNNVSEYPFIALNCKSSNPTSMGIFESRNTLSQKHEIRGTFNSDGTLRNLFYMFEGEYKSEKEAATASSAMHADYNIFMGQSGKDAGVFTPTFTPIDKKAKFSLYIENKDLEQSVYSVLLLNREKVDSLDVENIKENYISYGFNCQLEEKNNN